LHLISVFQPLPYGIMKEEAELIIIDKESFGSTLARNPARAESMSRILSERRAGLDAEGERLDAAVLVRRRKDLSGQIPVQDQRFFRANIDERKVIILRTISYLKSTPL
jgi:hypothetical protein